MKAFLSASKSVLHALEDWIRIGTIVSMTVIVFVQIVARIFSV